MTTPNSDQPTTPTGAGAEGGSLNRPCSAGDHDGLKCEDVIRYLRAEATRDVSEPWSARWMPGQLRYVADYLADSYQQNGGGQRP